MPTKIKKLTITKENNETDAEKAKREMIEKFNLTKEALMNEKPEDFISSSEYEEEVL